MNRKMQRMLGILCCWALVAVLAAPAMAAPTPIKPLLNNTQWGQGDNSGTTYSLYTPLNSTMHTRTGWLATAVGQIFNYHSWPSIGTGTITAYTKLGITVAANTLSTTTTSGRPYIIASNSSSLKVRQVTSASSSSVKQSVARLLNDIGNAFTTTYRNASSVTTHAGSIINGSISATPFATNFYYKTNASVVYGKDYTAGKGGAWMRLIQNEVNHSRPVVVRLGNDTVYYKGANGTNYPRNYIFVVDGYNNTDPGDVRVHINWGNGTTPVVGNSKLGLQNDWYRLNVTSATGVGSAGSAAQLPTWLRWGGANYSNMSAIIKIIPSYSNVTLLSPVNASSSSHADSDIPKTPYIYGPYKFSFPSGSTPSTDYNYFAVEITPPAGSTQTQYWPASYCNSTRNRCDALLHLPSTLLTTGVHRWRVRGVTSASTTTYGEWTNYRKFNATKPRDVRTRTPNGSITTAPTDITWFRSPGAVYYQFKLYKGSVAQSKVVSGTSGRGGSVAYWYNASAPGTANNTVSAWGGYSVDCSSDTNICSLPWTVITNGGTVDLTTVNSAAGTGTGDYYYTVTPYGAAQGNSTTGTFYLNGTTCQPKAPTIYCPGTIMSGGSHNGHCNVTNVSPMFKWTDTVAGQPGSDTNNLYEFAFTPAGAASSRLFDTFVLRNSTKMIMNKAGYATYNMLNTAATCASGYCNATLGTVSETNSLLSSTGKYYLYIRGYNKNSAGTFQAGDWANYTFWMSPLRPGRAGNLTPRGALTTNRETFYPHVKFNAPTNATWYAVDFVATPVLGSAAVTKQTWFHKSQICVSEQCTVNATRVSNSSFYYGVKPSFTWKVTPYSPAITGTITSGIYSSTYTNTTVVTGSTKVPPVPVGHSPKSYSDVGGTYVWNSSQASGNATYADFYICKQGATVVSRDCPYHDYIPISNSSYRATDNGGTRLSAYHGTPAATCATDGSNWQCTVTIADSNMSKGLDSGATWVAGKHFWGLRNLNPNGYNTGSGLSQFGIGNFTK